MRPWIALLSPAPSMIVVLSLSMRTQLGLAELIDLDLVQLDAEVFHDRLAAGEDGDIFEHRLAAIAVARRFHCRDIKNAAKLVHDQRRQGFAFNVFGNDQQRPLGLLDFLQQRDQLGGRGNLVLVNQDKCLFQLDRHLIRIGDEIGRKIPAVKLHSLDNVDVGLEALAFLDGDDAILADALERIGHDVADLAVVVGGDARRRWRCRPCR